MMKKYIYVFRVAKQNVYVQSNTMGEAEDNLRHWLKNKYPNQISTNWMFSERKDNPPPRPKQRIEELVPPRNRKTIKNPKNETDNTNK